VASRPEYIQRLPIAEEHCRLRFAHDHLGTDPKIANARLRKTMDDLIPHLTRVFNDIKNPGHDISPLQLIADSL
jgi:hypothetical protein